MAWHGLGVCPLGVHLAFSSLDASLRSTGRFMPGLDRICLSSDPHSGSDLPSLDLFCACAPLPMDVLALALDEAGPLLELTRSRLCGLDWR